jgi:hypothetical protein
MEAAGFSAGPAAVAPIFPPFSSLYFLHTLPSQVSHVLKPGQVTHEGVALPIAAPGTEGDYFFYDRVHPSGEQHCWLS